MKNVRLNTENQIVLKNFVNEVSKELNVEFEGYYTFFERGVPKGKKEKIVKFYSLFFRSISKQYDISFIPFSNDSIELWKINVNNRGKGLGSEIMSRILDVSDRTGIKVKLVPVDYDKDKNTPKDYLNSLKNWYSEGFGFKKSIFSFDPYYTYSPVEIEYKMVG